MKTVVLRTPSGKSRIIFDGSLNQLKKYCSGDRLVIVTDSNVGKIYGSCLPAVPLVEIPPGEKNKNLKIIEKLYSKFLELELDRSCFVIGLGGGILCDIVGFACSTFHRGIPFGFVPTTLLAQVDASIGGKNGVNFRGYKNLIGTFQQPRFSLLDYSLLRTLSLREIQCGLAETLKHALIGDSKLFDYLEKNHEAVLHCESQLMRRLIPASLRVKLAIVQRDERENKERMKLNLGHSLGHALEKIYSLAHGQAVSLGMIAAAKLSLQKGLLNQHDFERISRLLKNLSLPIRFSYPRHSLLKAAISKDKKKRGHLIQEPLLEKIGKVKIVSLHPEELVDSL